MEVSDLTLAAIAEYLGATLRGAENLTITGISTLQQAQPGQISFLTNPVYKKYLADCKASAVILSPRDAEDFSGNALLLENPYAGYARLTALFIPATVQHDHIHHSAVVADDCVIGERVSIAANAVIESGVSIGDGCRIGAGCFIGKDSKLGGGVVLHPNVSVYHGITIGDRCIVHSGVVIGADGFGFAPENVSQSSSSPTSSSTANFSPNNRSAAAKSWVKIHQLGAVIIGNDVELGANTCIDRGALGNTVIGDGVKIDNLVQIGHNCKVGNNTVISGCTAVAGSAEIGANCMIGGAVGIVGHISIADGVMITAMTLVTGSITKAGSYSSGTNCVETQRWRKNAVRFGQLEELHARVKQLENTLKQQK